MRVACDTCFKAGGGHAKPLHCGLATCSFCLSHVESWHELSEAYAKLIADALPANDHTLWMRFNHQTIELAQLKSHVVTLESENRRLKAQRTRLIEDAAASKKRKRKRLTESGLTRALVSERDLKGIPGDQSQVSHKVRRIRAMWEVPEQDADLVKCGRRIA